MSAQTLPIAVQLYSLRNVKAPIDQVLGEVAAIGFSGVETFTNYDLKAEDLKAALDKHGLQAVSAHVGIQMMDQDLDAVIKFHQTLGNSTLIVPWLPHEQRSTEASGWTALGRKLDGIGQRCADAGMRLLYHNHDFEMTVADGQTGIEWMLDAAKPANLGWEADVAWIARGGQEIERLLTKYSGRIPRMHAKDNAPAGQNQDEMGFADVGHGVVNWPSVLSAAKSAGVEWYVIEHDMPKDPMASIARSFEFLKTKVG